MPLNDGAEAVKDGRRKAITDLPAEILIYIYGFLTHEDLGRVAQTCKALHGLTIVPSLHRGCIFPVYISKSMKYNLSPEKVDFINSRKLSKVVLKSSFYEFSSDPLNAGQKYDEVVRDNLTYNVPLMDMIEQHMTEVRLGPYMEGDLIPEFLPECPNIKSLEMYVGHTLMTISRSEIKGTIRDCLSRLPHVHLIVHQCLSERGCHRIMQNIPKLTSLSFDSDYPIEVKSPYGNGVCLLFEGGEVTLPADRLLELHRHFGNEFRYGREIGSDLPAFMALLLRSEGVKDVQWPPGGKFEAEP